jgi:hypothetical protein
VQTWVTLIYSDFLEDASLMEELNIFENLVLEITGKSPSWRMLCIARVRLDLTHSPHEQFSPVLTRGRSHAHTGQGTAPRRRTRLRSTVLCGRSKVASAAAQLPLAPRLLSS